jgi:uncharacterized membrane protein
MGTTTDGTYKFWRLSGFGAFTAALFLAASLTPSLVPREPVMQGALSGVTAALGYAVGSFLVWAWGALLLPTPEGRANRLLRLGFLVLALVTVILALARAADWQNATRRVMDLPPVETAHPLIVGVVAAVVFGILWLAGSAFTMVVRRAARAFSRVLPGRLGPALGIGVAVLVFWALIDGLLVRQGLAVADRAFAAGEQVFNPGQDAPTDPMMTGGPGSLVTWEDLGNRGRDFIARTPSAEEIAAFHGPDAQRPVRVYVGRVSAPTAQERAELALAELIRQGGFERELLVVTTPVGTGWMDPGAHDSLDFMWGGDVAHVGAQYSYLTSVLSIITNVEYGLDQARALFDVIYGHWTSLPPDDRPVLYLHGLSQGAMNSQAELPLLDVLGDPPAGAMWAGSPFLSPVWSHVRENRVPGSPAWRPRFGNGSLVRVTNQEDVLDDAEAPWGPIRLVFLNYGSDPIVNFDLATLWRPSAFLEAPRAPDVAPEMRWYPLVTALQITLDMVVALSVEGYGHFYVAEDYIDAWAALTDPPDWDDTRATELKDLFAERAPPW